MIRQNAILTQENGMRPHACALFDVASAWELPGSAACLAKEYAVIAGECSAKKSSANIAGSDLEKSGLVETAPFSEVPVGTGTLVESRR
jgi:hypothetical protein